MKKKILKKRKINEIRSKLLKLIDSEIQKNKFNPKKDILINSMTREQITKKYEAYNNFKIETATDTYSNTENDYEYYSTSINFDYTTKTLVSPHRNQILREETHNTKKKRNKSTTNCSDICLLDENTEKFSPVKTTTKLVIGEKKFLKENNDENNKSFFKFLKNGPLLKKKDTIGTITAINNALLKVEIQYEFEEMKKKKKKEIELKQKRAIRNLRNFCFSYLKLKHKNNNLLERKQSEGNISKINKKNKTTNIKFSNVTKKNKKYTKTKLTKNPNNINKTGLSSKTKPNFSGFLNSYFGDEENKNKKNNKKNKKDNDAPNYCEISEDKRKTNFTQLEKKFFPKSKFNKNNKIIKTENNNNDNLNSANRKSYQTNNIHFTFNIEKAQEENNENHENSKPKKDRVSSRYMTHKAGKNIFLKNIEKVAESKINKEIEKVIKSNNKKHSNVEKNDVLFNTNNNINSLRINSNIDNSSLLNFYQNNGNKRPIKIKERTKKHEKNKKKTNNDNPNTYTSPFELNEEENTSVNSEKIQKQCKKNSFFKRSDKRKLTYEKKHTNNY